MSFFYLHKLETLNFLTKNCTKVKNKSRNHKSRRRYRFKVTKVKMSYGKNCESRKQKKPSLKLLIA